MTSFTPIRAIFGTYTINEYPEDVRQGMLDVLERYDAKDLDTAYTYPDSEKIIGETGAPKKGFMIHTKAPAWKPHCLSRTSLEEGMRKSLEQLGVDSVETYFLHAPDATTPLEETLAAVNELHASGKFKHFGLSNFPAADVQKIHDICTAHSYVLPTRYEGNYNPLSRHIERTLFPLLRRLGIAFYAYSPLAGGFLARSSAAQITSASAATGRASRATPIGAFYHGLYARPSLLAALADWDALATEARLSRAALAYRWVAYSSALRAEAGDAVIVGASRVAQLEETLRVLGADGGGPLDPRTVERIDRIWEAVKAEAPLDNAHPSVVGGSESLGV
ncbi:MAG: hypothetical protein M1819_005739 [Sarea resinae]|nr:MAG: hypothetical protein M1819_005739 [Sarea resinae]